MADSVLGRASALIDAFRADDVSISLSELSRRTGIPKATAHRLMAQLTDLRIVERSGSGYRLGMKLFELGQRSPQSRDLRNAARPYLEDLRDATHETVHLAVLDGAEVLYLDKLEGHHGSALHSRVGSRLPANCTGLGKALLAFAEPRVLTAVVEAGLPRLTTRSLAMPGLLVQELARIRQEGVAFEREESSAGVGCAACPVMGSTGAAVAAISVSGYLARMEPERFALAVRTAALAISRRLDDRQGDVGRPPRPGSPSRTKQWSGRPRALVDPA